MYPQAIEFQRARIEHMISEEQERIEYMADLAEFLYEERNDRIAEAMEALDDLDNERFLSLPSKELEDLELAARLRDMADRIEGRWK